MKLPNLYSEVGWNRELFVPMSVIRHRDFLSFSFLYSYLTATL
ncbi:hypothetical protein HMPREF1377_00505 [Enterococcus faecium R494]|nr:hypothetical protein HMPREF1377_00505 [Enterococcus faecium R494]MBL4988728.1 glycyl-tRNA synthetase alpha subunit [Enterococcus lactis]MBL4991243.1 glycyl-tRNA synthetase alpha subunit [Enterococcus lactis]